MLAEMTLAIGLATTSLPSPIVAMCGYLEYSNGCGSAGLTEEEVWLQLNLDPDYEDIFGEPDDDGELPCAVMHRGECTFRISMIAPPTSRPISLSDIAHFRPRPPVDVMEPNGWAIVGLDTNFFSTGDAEIVDGALLGQPASVRFTPVSWRWTYGDGTSSVASTRGSSWASQGILEFDPTPTSHVYRQPGTYLIDLGVDYRAEYRFGGGAWTRIPGVLSVPANQLEATAGDAKTVLVADDCRANPRGSGC